MNESFKDSRLPIAIVIATRDRPEEMRRLLERLSLLKSEFQVIVVADSSTANNFDKNSAELMHRFHRKECVHLKIGAQSLTMQKNEAFQFIRESESFSLNAVQVLDDDTLPSAGYLKSSFELLREKKAIGVSGVTSDLSETSKNVSNRLFNLAFGLGSRPGTLSTSGIGTPSIANSGLQKVDWLIGCSMWNIQATEGLYNSNYLGSCLFEDVEFSIRQRHGEMWVNTSLVLEHQSSPANRPNEELYWYRFAKNRYELVRGAFVQRNWYLWGNVGLFLQISLGSQLAKRKAIRGLWMGTRSAISNGAFL